MADEIKWSDLSQEDRDRVLADAAANGGAEILDAIKNTDLDGNPK